jgi:hypothetical protein
MSAVPTSRSTAPERGALALALLLLAALPAPAGAQVRFACSKPTSARIPCHFHTPSGNIRCSWTPRSQSVICVRVSTRRGYVLRPTGRAKPVEASLAHAGEKLPLIQEIVFPRHLSCRDSAWSITCNQDEGSGFFTIGPRGSHSG